MFFKRLLLLALPALLTSCSLKLNDPVTKKISSVNTGSGCLAKAGDVFEHFANGELSEREHDAFFACLDRALNTFANFADGKSKEHFEPEELGNFLTKYFLKGHAIQPALLREAMVLKRAFVGGSPDNISRVELRRIIHLFGVLKNSSGLMLPVMPLRVDSFLKRGFTADQFEDALRRFETSIESFGEAIKQEQQAYPFDHMAALIKELREFMYKEKVPANHWTETLLKFSQVIRPAKVIFVSPPRDEIAASDWPKFFRLAPRYYTTYLRSQFFLSSALSTFSTDGLQRIERTYAHFTDIFDFVLEQRPGRTISSAEIEDFIQTLHAQGMLGCQPETARAFVKAVFGRLLGGISTDENFTITKDSLNRFKENFRYGLEGLHSIEALYRGRYEKGATMTREEIEATPVEQLVNATLLKNPLSREAAEDVRGTPRSVRTFFAGESFTLSIPRHGENPAISHLHLIRIHALRTLNRLLIHAYGDGSKTELSEAQLNTFMNDIFPIMLEWQLVDEGTRASLAKRLFEASLFLHSSDGSKGLTAKEALELESLLLSTVSYAPLVHKELFEATKARPECSSQKLDVQNKPTVPAACYRSEFIARAAKIWAHLPGLADYMTQKPLKEQEELFDRMANFLRKGKAKAEDYSLSDTQSFVLLPYYVELLFSRFDANGDGMLDNAEGEAAYPVFRPFLAAKAAEKGYTDDKTHRAIFNFLLAYRQLPTDSQWSFVIRRYILGDKPFRVDRGQVVEILDKLMSL